MNAVSTGIKELGNIEVDLDASGAIEAGENLKKATHEQLNTLSQQVDFQNKLNDVKLLLPTAGEDEATVFAAMAEAVGGEANSEKLEWLTAVLGMKVAGSKAEFAGEDADTVFDAEELLSATPAVPNEVMGETYQDLLASGDATKVDQMAAKIESIPDDVSIMDVDRAAYVKYVKEGGTKEFEVFYGEKEAREAHTAEIDRANEVIEAAVNAGDPDKAKGALGKLGSFDAEKFMKRLGPLFAIFKTFAKQFRNIMASFKGETPEVEETYGQKAAKELRDNFDAERENFVEQENEKAFNDKIEELSNPDKWADVNIKGETGGKSFLEANFQYPDDVTALDKFGKLLNAGSGSKESKLLGVGFTMDQILGLQDNLEFINFETTTKTISYFPKPDEAPFSFKYEEGAKLLEAVKNNATVKSLKIDQLVTDGDYSEEDEEKIRFVLSNATAENEGWVKFGDNEFTLNPNGKFTRVNDVRKTFAFDGDDFKGFMPRISNIYTDLTA